MERSAAPSCLYLIHSLPNSLSERDRRIADYILNDPAKAVHLSIEELAEAAQVFGLYTGTLRKKARFRGYQQFRIALASEALAPEARIYETIVDSGEDPVRLAFSSASKALEITSSMIDSQDLYKLASRIIEANCVYLLD